ncbi:putative F-box protein At1g70970 [Capsella rubella]|uniref:putative F-box protein At1g70970 n=1 Tax=Capsella rubella TaxID=81985 RepID=UPI000CD564D2|nr:putative F-box protein At1g70970 [Capsella rubella]
MEKTSFETLSKDLQINILTRLPLKSLMKSLVVSKTWATMIREKEFNVDYLERSTTRPRVMFMVERYKPEPHEPVMSWFDTVYKEQRGIRATPYSEVLFHSVYRDEEPFLSCGQQQLRLSLHSVYDVSQPIRGLICLKLRNKLAVCNPGTKKFQTLPEIQVREDSIISSFLGYDEATDVFKVFCLTRMKSGKPLDGTKEYLVLTVESTGQESWRSITCEYDHEPLTEGICKGGVLYYGAYIFQPDEANDQSYNDTLVVMSFNVRSEEFSIIRYPNPEAAFQWLRFVIYNEKIALVDDADFDKESLNVPINGNKVFYIWVMDERTREWERTRIEILDWEEAVGDKQFIQRNHWRKRTCFCTKLLRCRPR